MPTPYEKKIENDEYQADIKVSPAGIPMITIRDKDDQRPSHVEVTYLPNHVGASPTIRIRDAEYLTTDEARNISKTLMSASEIADMVHEEVSRTFLLPERDPAGDSDKRAAAIVSLIAQGTELTPENIDRAIASCYQPDQTSRTMKDLRAIQNMFANDETVQDTLKHVKIHAAEYRRAREHEQELAHAPADDYDAMAHRAADAKRTSAHNTLIRDMVRLAKFAAQSGMDNGIASIASMENPFSSGCRERIAQMAYEIS